jgi:argininosuccinate lyase
MMAMSQGETKLWGGRFAASMDATVQAFNNSFAFDQRLASSDIAGCLAYATALEGAGLLDHEELAAISNGLEQIGNEFSTGSFVSLPSDEDIHTAIERRLHELAGSVAGKLHTGRSRNDQVATALRHYLMQINDELTASLRSFQAVLVNRAESHLGIVMPGYTHLQRAQPILFSHWLMSFFWKFNRDIDRLAGAKMRASVCPLGSGALAGNPFDIDREQMADELGFAHTSENSLDAVEDRDFVVDFLYASALLQTHLSSLAETLILWSSESVAFIRLSEKYCTGSSLMPQKRNPDMLELIRGKSGRVLGHLTGMIATLKGLPSGYNKDLQEDKEGLFDVIDTLMAEVPIAEAIVGSMMPNAAHMSSACCASMMATDLADYLVLKGVPFREAHHIVGSVVKQSEQAGVAINVLPLSSYQSIHPAFAEDVIDVFNVHASIDRRQAKGGTALIAVACQLEEAHAILAKLSD